MVTLGDSRSAAGRSSVTGDLLVLCSSLFYGCYTIAIRRCAAVRLLGMCLLPSVTTICLVFSLDWALLSAQPTVKALQG